MQMFAQTPNFLPESAALGQTGEPSKENQDETDDQPPGKRAGDHPLHVLVVHIASTPLPLFRPLVHYQSARSLRALSEFHTMFNGPGDVAEALYRPRRFTRQRDNQRPVYNGTQGAGKDRVGRQLE